MANTRGATHIHGPNATGTIKAGSVTPSSAAPSVGPGSGANSGNRTTIKPGKVSSGFGSPISGGTGNKVNSGGKTTVGEGTKKAIVGSGGKGVGATTPYKRKKQRVLGTGGQKPA